MNAYERKYRNGRWAIAICTVLLVFFAARLALSGGLHDSRNKQAIHADDIVISFAPSTTDKWGVNKIYPTCDGCREWYVNMANPLSDPLVAYSDNTGLGIVLDGGVWISDGREDGGASNVGIRMQVGSLDAGVYWHNVEMTGYVLLIDYTVSEEFSWYARSGGTHSGSRDCTSGAYHNELAYDGGFTGSQKEVWHTGGYTTTHRGGTNGVAPLLGRWVGFKAIVYDVENGTGVQTELWEDDGNVTNSWVHYTGALDDLTHSWGGGTSDCGHLDTDILTGAFKWVAFRADNAMYAWKFFSVREIQPPHG